MQLQTLSPDELAFLTAPPTEHAKCAGADWLQGKLAATLAARLRRPVTLEATPAEARSATIEIPVWQPDAALATLWLTRRLGGTRAAGSTPFVPRSLIETLDAALAEAWLGNPQQPPAAPFAWVVTTTLGGGRLALQLPEDTSGLTRWARGVIRHA